MVQVRLRVVVHAPLAGGWVGAGLDYFSLQHVVQPPALRLVVQNVNPWVEACAPHSNVLVSISGDHGEPDRLPPRRAHSLIDKIDDAVMQQWGDVVLELIT